MSYQKEEVKNFEAKMKKSLDNDANEKEKEGAFVGCLTDIYAVLVDIRDALIPNNPNDKNT